jgi:hypothetical protein
LATLVTALTCSVDVVPVPLLAVLPAPEVVALVPVLDVEVEEVPALFSICPVASTSCPIWLLRLSVEPVSAYTVPV